MQTWHWEVYLLALLYVVCGLVQDKDAAVLVEFLGIPKNVLASGKFLQDVKDDSLGPLFLVGPNCANLQEST